MCPHSSAVDRDQAADHRARRFVRTPHRQAAFSPSRRPAVQSPLTTRRGGDPAADLGIAWLAVDLFHNHNEIKIG